MRRRALIVAALAMPLVVRAARDSGTPQEQLRRGGMVLLMRCASIDSAARSVGERLRRMGTTIGRVYTSPAPRCRETAGLAFGHAEDWAPLGSFPVDRPDLQAEAAAHVRKRILGYTIRKPAGTVVMVTHEANIAALTKLSVAPAEIVIVQPDGCCGVKVAGRLAFTQ